MLTLEVSVRRRTESSGVTVLVIRPVQILADVKTLHVFHPEIRVGWAGGCEYQKLEEGRLKADRARASLRSIDRESIQHGLLTHESLNGFGNL